MAELEAPDRRARSAAIGRAARLARPGAALLPTALGVIAVSVIFLMATAVLFAVALLGAGCAFTQKVVKRTILSSPEMCFEDLDPHRDLPGSGGIGGSGTGGC